MLLTGPSTVWQKPVWEKLGEGLTFRQPQKESVQLSGHRGQQCSTPTVHIGDGVPLTSPGSVIGRWKEDSEDLLNPDRGPAMVYAKVLSLSLNRTSESG